MFSKLFLKSKGWTINKDIPNEAFGSCVLIAAPHTSNWDFPLAISAMRELGVNIRYTIKEEWMRFPMRLFMGPLGGIGINRRPKKEGDQRPSVVDAIADLYKENKNLCVIMQPEGTRSPRHKWKSGFYYVALKAQVPIVMGYLDYENKVAGIGKVLYPTGDFEKDLMEICAFYENIPAKFPEKFKLDDRYIAHKAQKKNAL